MQNVAAGRPVDLIRERLFPHVDDSSSLSVSCYRADFSASRIAHAVEDCDAHLLNLNLTSETTPAGEIIIDLRISHRDPARVARSLERYGYSVVAMDDAGGPDIDTMRDRVRQLMLHLGV